MSIKEEIVKDVDFIILSDKEKKARLDNDMTQSAHHCTEIVSTQNK